MKFRSLRFKILIFQRIYILFVNSIFSKADFTCLPLNANLNFITLFICSYLNSLTETNSTPFSLKHNYNFHAPEFKFKNLTEKDLKEQYDLIMKRNKFIRIHVIPAIIQAKIDQRNNVKSTLYKKYLISRVKVGGRVLVQPRGNGIRNKFRPRFFGPYKVIEINKKANRSIIVDVENESKEIKTFDAHVSTLSNLGSFSEETKYLFDDSESRKTKSQIV